MTCAQDGSSVDIQALFFKYTLDTTTAFLFGQSTSSLKEDGVVDGTTFAANFDTAQDFVVKRFRLLDLYWLVGGPRFSKACHAVHEFVDRLIEKRQAISDSSEGEEDSEQYVFFDAVAHDAKGKEALRGQLLNILLAGRDTTSCLLTWTLSATPQTAVDESCLQN